MSKKIQNIVYCFSHHVEKGQTSSPNGQQKREEIDLKLAAVLWQDHMIDSPVNDSPIEPEQIIWVTLPSGYEVAMIHCGMPDLMRPDHEEKIQEHGFLKKKFERLGWAIDEGFELETISAFARDQDFQYGSDVFDGLLSKIDSVILKADVKPSSTQRLVFFLTYYEIAGSCNGGKIRQSGVLMLVEEKPTLEKYLKLCF